MKKGDFFASVVFYKRQWTRQELQQTLCQKITFTLNS